MNAANPAAGAAAQPELTWSSPCFCEIDLDKALPLAHIPQSSVTALHAAMGAATAQAWRVTAYFGVAGDAPQLLQLFAVLCDDANGRLWVGRATLEGEELSALAPLCPQVQLFEREIAEQWGLKLIDHPWHKPVRFHPPYSRNTPLDHTVHSMHRHPGASTAVGEGDFYRVDGDGVHEVAVGPVHAGVIEPGHFRFQCYGEEVFHLEISLGYQHRGIERALRSGPPNRYIHYIETAAGDTTVGHATAYAQTMEALAACQIPARSLMLRGIALELERLANHVGDLGALAGDVGFLPTASYCGRLRGDFLNMTAMLCGNRFGRGMVAPGGVMFDADTRLSHTIQERLSEAERDTMRAVELLWNNSGVLSRFEDTGALAASAAQELGLVGPPARACGLARDVRCDFPTGVYRFCHIPVSTWHSGDVFARAYVRALEIKRSIAFTKEQLHSLAHSAIATPAHGLTPQALAVSLVEGWRGEICHVALTNATGALIHYKIVDPSFHNWSGLARALRGQAISDFPLCNKSFNLSYCGHDL